MDQLEEQQASPELLLFFKRLLTLKEYVKTEATNTQNEVLNKIHAELESIIKEKP